MYNIIKYRCKLLVTSNCILKTGCELLYDRLEHYKHQNWAYRTENKWINLSDGYAWFNEVLHPEHLSVTKQRIIDQAMQ